MLMHRLARDLFMAILAAAVITAAFLAGYGSGGSGMPGAVGPGSPEVHQRFRVFWEAWEVVSREFYDRSSLDPQKMTYGAIRGMLESLGDSTTTFSPPASTRREADQLQGSFGGVGVTVEMKDKRLIVVEPIEGTPAARAGLKAGDVIIKVDDRDIAGLTRDEAIDLIRGPVGTKVKLTVARGNLPDPISYELVRAKIPTPTVKARMLDGDVGHVWISSFSETTPGELSKALSDLRRQGARALVLDLRNDLGGYLHIAVTVASQFLNDGVVVWEDFGSNNKRAHKVTPGGMATDLPMAVLVNKWTASAAEIAASAIQDSGRGILIGEKTFGKGTAQVSRGLSDGSSVHVTIAHWLTSKERRIHGQGLVPDLEIKATEEDVKENRDPQLARALEYLKSGLLAKIPATPQPTVVGR